ncbi:hypothetical protein [Adhaeribacter soli]|uniref:Uncharacterized protein n=1 Tax=Adhaeribacter soli TaxID=2607655 RepID=A0A5N1IRT8_9BACT|nr:hypothetical protein [Adhaeribacter soli]KAA9332885.1 hypothetical protein F0P94_12900 [Adhaeribacter soli]
MAVLRKVSFKRLEWQPDTFKYIDTAAIENGYFHKWVDEVWPSADGKMKPVTLALIEAENGEVVKANPTTVTFQGKSEDPDKNRSVESLQKQALESQEKI